jgi:hypothetical protein
MKPCTSDMSLFYKHPNDGLGGMTGTHVDDSISAGTFQLGALTAKMMERFESRKKEMDNTKFEGVNIRTTKEGFTLDQTDYIEKVTPLPKDYIFSDFMSKRAQLSWISHTRPEICCAVNMAAQVTNTSFSDEKICALNKVTKHLKSNASQGLTYHKLDKVL